MYKLKDPTEKEIVAIIVPIHFPNNIPDRRSKGDPNPKRIIHTTANTKKRIKLNIKFVPI